MSKRTQQALLIVLLVVGTGLGVPHLYAVSAVGQSLDVASDSVSFVSISILEERDPDQAFIVMDIENPTGLPVSVTLSETYSVSLDDLSGTALLSGQSKVNIGPQDTVHFQLIMTLSEGWSPSDSNVSVTITGEINLSSNYLWVFASQTSDLNITENIVFFE